MKNGRVKKGRLPNYDDPAFQAKREAEIKRRISMEAYGDEPVALAFRGDAKPLADILRAAGHEDAAWAIERKFQHGSSGRPKGSRSAKNADPARDAQIAAAEDFKRRKREWCAASGYKRVPPIVANDILDKIMEERGLTGETIRQAIKNHAKRGSRKET